MSRMAAGEAEILSIAVAASGADAAWRGLLDCICGGSPALLRAVFLEVDEDNKPALRLYRRAGFRESRPPRGYYPAQEASPPTRWCCGATLSDATIDLGRSI